MSFRNAAWCALVLVIVFAPLARAQEPMPMGTNTDQMKLAAFPGLPTCIPGALLNGDATKGAFIAYAKGRAGCIVPWHWHTASEHVMLVSGVLRMETKDGKPFELKAGGFALVPSHHVHQARCLKSCAMYIYSDGAFDMHYVDSKGNDLTPDDALKAVKETPGRPPG
jgi:quercetin dioxygenase-like cupin family protein